MAKLTPYNKAKRRLERYCILEERSIFQVRKKLYEVKDIDEEERDSILAYLQEEDFINLDRFAELYVRSKWNQKSWGRNKIRAGLVSHGIPEKTMISAIITLDKKLYKNRLKELLETKEASGRYTAAQLIRYALQKGYEYDLVKEVLKK